MGTRARTLTKTEVSSAEEQLARDKSIHVLTVLVPHLDSSKPGGAFLLGPPYGRYVVVIGFFQA